MSSHLTEPCLGQTHRVGDHHRAAQVVETLLQRRTRRHGLLRERELRYFLLSLGRGAQQSLDRLARGRCKSRGAT